MSKKHLFFFVLLLRIGATQSQSTSTHGFKDISMDTVNNSIPYHSGLEDYYSFRIPALVKTKTALIAFAEGRKNSTSDFGDIDLVYRRSKDGGKHWESLRILYDQDTMAVQNPVPIYVSSENKVVLLFNTTTQSEHDILNNDYGLDEERKAFMTSSSDNGLTWSQPIDITRQVKKKHWRWHALGPVHGIELQQGKYRGRLVAPVAISIAKGNKAYCMALLYSDDQGEHWHIGAVDENLTDAVQANETTLVELNDGRIYVNTRDQNGGSLKKNRGETFSADGGKTFSQGILESDKFPSPVVQSALLRWTTSAKSKSSMLLFSTPSHLDQRRDLIILASNDESQSWQPLYKIHHGMSAYSDMVQVGPNILGVLYETDDYTKIRFKWVRME